MNLAKLSSNGQITVPVEARRRLRRPSSPMRRLASESTTRTRFSRWSTTCVVACRDPCPGRHQRCHLGPAVPELDTGHTLALVLTEHQLVRTEVIVDELREVVGRAAVAGDVDVIGTGDKAFLSLALEQPRTMTARAFLDAYYGTG